MLLMGCLAAGQARAGVVRDQVMALQAGWNAVFLEVYPVQPDPAALFAGSTVDVVASLHSAASTAQFIAHPGAELFRRAGWGVWYAEDRPDAFLKTLHAILGQQAYLIHATRACSVTVSGNPVMPDLQWEPNAFNFVGFSVDPVAPPTFARLFAGSPAHRLDRIYRLTGGTWQRVDNAASAAPRAGEAFWIYCDGASTYQGPLRVEATLRVGLVLAGGSGSLVLRNLTDFPVAPTLEHVASGTNTVPLSLVIAATESSPLAIQTVAAPKPNGPWTQALPPLEGGASIRVPLELRPEAMTAAQQDSLLKISTDLGTVTWVPIAGRRGDLTRP